MWGGGASIRVDMLDSAVQQAVRRRAGRSGEGRLRARLRGGDDEAFDEMVREYQEWLGRLVQRLLGYEGAVADVVQEVLLAVWVNRRKFRGDCSVGTWLARIAVNKCRSYQRRLKVRRKRPET